MRLLAGDDGGGIGVPATEAYVLVVFPVVSSSAWVTVAVIVSLTVFVIASFTVIVIVSLSVCSN